MGLPSSICNTKLLHKVSWRFSCAVKHIEVSDGVNNRKLTKKGSLMHFASDLMLYSPPSPPDPPIPQKPRAIALGITSGVPFSLSRPHHTQTNASPVTAKSHLESSHISPKSVTLVIHTGMSLENGLESQRQGIHTSHLPSTHSYFTPSDDAYLSLPGHPCLTPSIHTFLLHTFRPCTPHTTRASLLHTFYPCIPTSHHTVIPTSHLRSMHSLLTPRGQPPFTPPIHTFPPHTPRTCKTVTLPT